jgi:hypothetical protein
MKRVNQQAKAEAEVAFAKFVEEEPSFSLDSAPLNQGATNYLTRATQRSEPAILKYFATPDRWRNELFCLKHFAQTGVVPEVYATWSDRVIAMEFLHGRTVPHGALDEVRSDPRRLRHVSYQFGLATGRLAITDPPANEAGYNPMRDWALFTWSSDLGATMQEYVQLGRRVQASVPAYADDFYSDSLRLVEDQAERVDQYPQILVHEDLGNFHVHEGELTGLFDFEVCRSGNELMQLHCMLAISRAFELDKESVIDGYTAEAGTSECFGDALGLLAMAHFGAHIRICQYGRWDGSQQSVEHSEHYVSRTKDRMVGEVLQSTPQIDVESWFPSLC